MMTDDPPVDSLVDSLVDSSPVPVLVRKYLELEMLLADINECSSSDMSDAEVNELVRVHERIARKVDFTGLRHLLRVSDRSSFTEAGYSSLFGFTRSELRLTKGQTMSRIRGLEAVGRFHTMQGEELAPKCPAAEQAWSRGLIGAAHMDVMLDVRKQIPSASDPAVYDVVDQWMTEEAVGQDPTQLIAAGRAVLARVDPDGRLTDDSDRARKRSLGIGDQGVDLMAKISGTLDPETLALLRTVMDVWAAPGMNNPADPDSPAGASDDPKQDKELIKAAAERDTRSKGQQFHDALKAILKTILECNLLGKSHRGLPAQLIITMTKEQLDECAGIARTASGVDIPVKEALNLAARSDKYLAVFADHSAEVLYLARTKRTAQKGQRLALFVRDRGCSHPGCTNPATWVEAHHLLAWINGGLTDIDMMGSACPEHHKLVGDGPGQWQTIMITEGPDAGRVGWIPPAGVDPERTPRVNRAQHVNETFAAAWQKVLADRQAVLAEKLAELTDREPEVQPDPESGDPDQGEQPDE
jgi:hypothetical protein